MGSMVGGGADRKQPDPSVTSRVEAVQQQRLLQQPTEATSLTTVSERTCWRRSCKRALPVSLPNVVNAVALGLNYLDHQRLSQQYNSQYDNTMASINAQINAVCGPQGCENDGQADCYTICVNTNDSGVAAYDTLNSNLDELGSNTGFLVLLGCAGAIMGCVNFSVLYTKATPHTLKVVCVANLILGAGYLMTGALLPAAMTIMKPTAIAIGSYCMMSGGYIGVKAYGGIRSVCSRVSSCFRKCFSGN